MRKMFALIAVLLGLIWAGSAQAQIIEGNGLRNKLVGTEQADTIRGLGGPDEMYGLAGMDTLNGGGDWDMIDGGPGADAIYGRGGSDLIYAGDDKAVDKIVCGRGYDVVYARKNDVRRGCEETYSYG